MLARWVAAFVAGVLCVLSSVACAADNLIFVTLDGFRWQEVFGGADESLLNKESGGVANVPALKQRYWKETPAERREILMPFLWQHLVKHGQLFGDPTRNATAQVTNGKKFSYPGYNEMFVGFPDDRITSNAPNPNPNINVLEFLQRDSHFAGRIAAYATWDVMHAILNPQRSGLFVQVGWRPINDQPLSPAQVTINEMQSKLPVYWKDNVWDAVTMAGAKEHLLKHRPRVLYVGLGETDEWAHARRYDLYLDAAQKGDQFLRELWELTQSLPDYKDKTAFVITTDHGRGLTGKDWTNHSAETVGAEFIWIAALGSGVAPLGVRSDVNATQSQIAPTLANLLGRNFGQLDPKIAKPLPLSK